MDFKAIVVQAMRDAARLRWGAIDQGGESGDMMHFDGYGTISSGTRIRKKIREKLDEPKPQRKEVQDP